MITVEEAQARIRAGFAPTAPELIGLAEAHGRVLAEDLVARRTQPPFAMSAMDGYAVRAADVTEVPARLRLIGGVAAGGRFDGVVGPGEAVRIFTGAPVPAGADTIVIQEDTTTAGDGTVEVHEAARPGQHIRDAGLDFVDGVSRIPAGTRLTARHLGLAAGMNRPWLMVHRRPRVAILPTGDEVALPGDPVGPNQIVSCNGVALAALVASAGGIPIQLGIAPDDESSLIRLAAGASGADLLLTAGGASVGDHDLVQKALGQAGLEVDFWKIALQPGKPLIFGRLGATPLLGLPGNPVSALICGLLFVQPALERLTGLPGNGPETEPALAGAALGPTDRRQLYLRATILRDDSGRLIATPWTRQDSSMISCLAESQGLIVRPPHAAAAAAGDRIAIIRFVDGALPF